MNTLKTCVFIMFLMLNLATCDLDTQGQTDDYQESDNDVIDNGDNSENNDVNDEFNDDQETDEDIEEETEDNQEEDSQSESDEGLELNEAFREVYLLGVNTPAIEEETYEDWIGSFLRDVYEQEKQTYFKISNNHIQWRYEGADIWEDLFLLTDITGVEAEDQEDIQFSLSDNFIKWQLENDSEWKELIDIDLFVKEDITDENELLLKMTGKEILWQCSQSESWQPLADFNSLANPSNDNQNVSLRKSNNSIEYLDTQDGNWKTVVLSITNFINDPESLYDFNLIYHDADFETEVSEDVDWVPVNTLGFPEMSKNDILELENDPELLQSNINTVYEALMYIHLSDFKAYSDNIRIKENGIDWEHHKPGIKAIETNRGNCAGVSNLLNYLLEDNYDEVGFIGFSRQDGSGHVFNYIKENGLYYFIDLTHYLNDYDNKGNETGYKAQYYNSDYVLSNLHKTSSEENYINYILESFNEKPVLVSMYQANNVLPIDSVHNHAENDLSIVYPDKFKEIVNIVYDNPDDGISYEFIPGPTQYPEKWEPYNEFQK